MFCFKVKKVLYDFIEGDLNKTVADTIRIHLRNCLNCTKRHDEMKRLLNLASQKRVPELSEQFWANFDRELKEKLAKERVTPRQFRLQPYRIPRISLKPALALATVFILLIVINFYLFDGLPTSGRLTALADERLLNDIQIIEELTNEPTILEDPDSLFYEIELLEKLS